MNIVQSRLFHGLYRCQNCGRDVVRVQRIRRFRLCDDCWERIVEPIQPDHTGPLSDELSLLRDEFWGWHNEMEKRYPTGRRAKYSVVRFEFQVNGGDYWPYCADCGQETKEFDHHLGQLSLFGRMRHKYCPRCEAIKSIESVYGMRKTLHPGWDDEDWLDLLLRSHPETFEIGVLPDFWFELKLKVVEKDVPF